eukprot:766061-Hanusia_phi.AAC.6
MEGKAGCTVGQAAYKNQVLTKLWEMQGLGKATSPAAVSDTSFYATGSPGSTPGAASLFRNKKVAGGDIGKAMSIFDQSFQTDPISSRRQGRKVSGTVNKLTVPPCPPSRTNKEIDLCRNISCYFSSSGASSNCASQRLSTSPG